MAGTKWECLQWAYAVEVGSSVMLWRVEVKTKTYNICIAPQTAYRSCSGAVHVTETPGAQPIGRRLSAPTDWPTTNQPYAALVCRLMVSAPVIRVITCNYMDYYSFTDPGGMESWVGLVGWPTADTLFTKWSHVNHRSSIDREKSASQRSTS